MGRGLKYYMWSLFLTVIGLLFVLEGMLPFLSPRFWRHMMQQLFIQSDRTMRIIGLISMLIGLALVCISHEFYYK